MDKTSYRVLTLTAGCMLLLSITAQRVIAWPCPPCPDCYRCTPTGCEPDCRSPQTCCGGECCDPDDCCNNQKCCSGQKCCTDSGAYCCPSGYTCCDGDCCDPDLEICCEGECCDKDLCEECVDGECKVCGGDPTLKCCPETVPSHCTIPCELEPTGACATSNTEDCPYCYPAGCSSATKKVYTGNEAYSCKYQGCEGDCVPDVDVSCYTEYDCANMFSISMEQCTWNPSSESYVCIPTPGLPERKCRICHPDPDDPGEPGMVPSSKCVG